MRGRLINILQRASRFGPLRYGLGAVNDLMLRAGPWPMRVEGHTLFPSTIDRMIVLALYRAGRADEFEMTLWRQLCEPGMRVVDIGANLGLYSLVASELVGESGHVWGFEADPTNADLFQRAIDHGRYSNVTLLPVAVADKAGWVDLTVRKDHRGFTRISSPRDTRDAHSVRSMPLDELLADVENVDLMKLDIEGAEYLAFQGMREILRRSPDVKIITEFFPAAMARFGHSGEAFAKFWMDEGFATKVIDEKTGTVVAADIDQIIRLASEREILNLYLERPPSTGARPSAPAR